MLRGGILLRSPGPVTFGLHYSFVYADYRDAFFRKTPITSASALMAISDEWIRPDIKPDGRMDSGEGLFCRALGAQLFEYKPHISGPPKTFRCRPLPGRGARWLRNHSAIAPRFWGDSIVPTMR